MLNRLCLSIIVLGAAASLPAHAAKKQLLQSSAAVGAGKLMIGGASLPIGPVGSASGNTTDGPYDVVTSIPEVSQSYYGSGAKSPGVIVQATDVTAQAQGSLSGTPYASASIAIGSVGVSLVPPVSKGGAAYLSVALTQAAGMSTYIPSGSAQGTAYGSTALGSVVVSGTLLPGPITAPVDAPANTIIFQNAYLTITVNAEIPAKPVGCGQNCGTLPQGIETDGVLVTFTDLVINGKTISGTLSAGQSISQ